MTPTFVAAGRRRPSALLTALIVTVLALSGALTVLPSAPAQALQAPVAFTAKDRPSYQTNGIAWSGASAGGLVFVGGSFSSIRPPGAAPVSCERRTTIATMARVAIATTARATARAVKIPAPTPRLPPAPLQPSTRPRRSATRSSIFVEGRGR